MELFVVGLLLLGIAVSPLVVLVLQLLTRARLEKLEDGLGALEERYGRRLAELEERIVALSGKGAGAPDPAAAAEAFAAPEGHAPASATQSTAPAGTARRRHVPRRARTSADWEELIGGNLLSKVGAVVTVIGIALGLGYSMRYLGPAGRVALALAASGAMLGIGALLENRERYRVFARGLIGGGWAGVYFTTFAMHGLEAARVIDSPAIGTILLIGVSVGMVLHSLLYRSQTVTGLAYLVTFATLAVVPVSRFALFASLPAAASLLYIGRRYRWHPMMVTGVVFTYGAYLLRGSTADVGPEDWIFGQLLLFVYWVLFETFDLTAYRTRRPGGIDETLMPLNAAGFIGASLLGWSVMRPDSLWAFFVLCAGMLTASAVLRDLWAPSFADEAEDAIRRPRFDGSDAALTIAMLMLVFGIGRRFDGWREIVAWLLQAQLLILTGLMRQRSWLRHFGSAVLLLPVAAYLGNELPPGDTFTSLGVTWFESTPLAMLLAAALYADRALVRRSATAHAGGLEYLYNGTGTFLVLTVVAYEVPDMWIAPTWFALGLGLAAYGVRRGAGGPYLQGYVVCVLSWLLMAFANMPADTELFGWPARWATALPMIAVLYGLAYLRPPAGERRFVGPPAAALDRTATAVCFGVATFLGAWFLLFEVSGSWLTVAWGLQGVALLVAGFVLRGRRVRLAGLALLGVCIGKLFVYDAAELETLFRIFSFIILGGLLLAVSFAYSRYREQIRKLL